MSAPADSASDWATARLGGAGLDAELEAEAERSAIEAVEAEQVARPQPINWLAWKDRTPPAREWWIQDWLSPSPTLCSGTGGIGKSLLWQTIATSLATGREFLAATARPLRVLIWACEDDELEIVRRQDAICAHFGIERAELHGKLFIEPRQGYDNTLLGLAYGQPAFTGAFFQLAEQMNDLGASVLVLDNIGQVYGANENDRHQVTVFVNGLQGMVRSRPFAPVLLGHVARATGSEFAGSAAWENACRMRWYMGKTLPDQPQQEQDETDGAIGAVYLAKRKANYSEKDYRRLTYQRGLLVPEDCARRFDEGHRRQLAETVVLNGLAKLKAAGIHGTDGKTSPDYLPKQLIAKGWAESHTRAELAAAMHRLMGAGKLKRAAVSTYGNRSTQRYGLVAA